MRSNLQALKALRLYHLEMQIIKQERKLLEKRCDNCFNKFVSRIRSNEDTKKEDPITFNPS